MPQTSDTLNDAYQAARDCEKSLELLQKTCCFQERSKKMISLVDGVRSLSESLQCEIEDHSSLAEDTLRQVEDVGAAIGKLYATCCTPAREKLYTRMYRAIGTINLAMWKIKGVAH